MKSPDVLLWARITKKDNFLNRILQYMQKSYWFRYVALTTNKTKVDEGLE